MITKMKYTKFIVYMTQRIADGEISFREASSVALDAKVPLSRYFIIKHMNIMLDDPKNTIKDLELDQDYEFSFDIPDHLVRNPKSKEKVEVRVLEDGVQVHSYEGTEFDITTIDQAVRFFEVDLEKYDIPNPVFNYWQVAVKDKEGRTKKVNLYQVKLKCQPKKKTFDFEKTMEEISKKSDKYFDRKIHQCHYQSKKIVVCLSDMHIGAVTAKHQGVLKTLDYSMEILFDYLSQVVDRLNHVTRNGTQASVHLAFLGDFIESFTGLNHINSWQGMHEGMSFGSVIVAAKKTMHEFISRINGVEKVYMVAGNHDRMSANRSLDVKGDAAMLLAESLRDLGHDVDYHPLLLSREIDRIQYLFTHNHHGFTKASISNNILKYGNQKLYNVIAGGHYHSRDTRKEFYKSNGYVMDSVNGRAVTVAPFFTGNFFSESIGYTSTAGYSMFSANEQKDNVDHLEVGLGRLSNGL